MPHFESGLIGHTGFVGSNLIQQHRFDACFNSKNIEDLANHSFDVLVCSGAPAEKWKSNANPAADLANMERLQSALSKTRATEVVLISTIDVYANPQGDDESVDPALISNHAYGTHRFSLERFVRTVFSKTHTLRLPGLFGKGLKKNVIFDLMNNNCLEAINPDSKFQYYCLDNIWSDIQMVRKNGIELLNLATEPIQTKTIIQNFFADFRPSLSPSKAAAYNMESKYGTIWGNSGRYLYSADKVMQELSQFIKGQAKQ
jgi:hypothetical protein